MRSEISLFVIASIQGKKSRFSCGFALCSAPVRLPGTLCPALGFPAYDPVGVSPVQGHQVDQRDAVSLPHRKAERIVFVQPEGEKASG